MYKIGETNESASVCSNR